LDPTGHCRWKISLKSCRSTIRLSQAVTSGAPPVMPGDQRFEGLPASGEGFGHRKRARRVGRPSHAPLLDCSICLVPSRQPRVPLSKFLTIGIARDTRPTSAESCFRRTDFGNTTLVSRYRSSSYRGGTGHPASIGRVVFPTYGLRKHDTSVTAYRSDPPSPHTVSPPGSWIWCATPPHGAHHQMGPGGRAVSPAESAPAGALPTARNVPLAAVEDADEIGGTTEVTPCSRS